MISHSWKFIRLFVIRALVFLWQHFNYSTIINIISFFLRAREKERKRENFTLHDKKKIISIACDVQMHHYNVVHFTLNISWVLYYILREYNMIESCVRSFSDDWLKDKFTATSFLTFTLSYTSSTSSSSDFSFLHFTRDLSATSTVNNWCIIMIFLPIISL